MLSQPKHLLHSVSSPFLIFTHSNSSRMGDKAISVIAQRFKNELLLTFVYFQLYLYKTFQNSLVPARFPHILKLKACLLIPCVIYSPLLFVPFFMYFYYEAKLFERASGPERYNISTWFSD